MFFGFSSELCPIRLVEVDESLVLSRDLGDLRAHLDEDGRVVGPEGGVHCPGAGGEAVS